MHFGWWCVGSQILFLFLFVGWLLVVRFVGWWVGWLAGSRGQWPCPGRCQARLLGAGPDACCRGSLVRRGAKPDTTGATPVQPSPRNQPSRHKEQVNNYLTHANKQTNQWTNRPRRDHWIWRHRYGTHWPCCHQKLVGFKRSPVLMSCQHHPTLGTKIHSGRPSLGACGVASSARRAWAGSSGVWFG